MRASVDGITYVHKQARIHARIHPYHNAVQGKKRARAYSGVGPIKCEISTARMVPNRLAVMDCAVMRDVMSARLLPE